MLVLPDVELLPVAIRMSERTTDQKSECFLSEQSCQSYFSEIKQVNPAEHLWGIN